MARAKSDLIHLVCWGTIDDLYSCHLCVFSSLSVFDSSFSWTSKSLMMSRYLSENSYISINSTRTINFGLVIPVLIALTGAGCLAISASNSASCNTEDECLVRIHRLSLGHEGCYYSVSQLGVLPAPRRTFPRLSRFDVACATTLS